MASAEDCWRCPFCERLHASRDGLAQHISNDACEEHYLDRVAMQRRKAKRAPAKRRAAEELDAMFERLAKGE